MTLYEQYASLRAALQERECESCGGPAQHVDPAAAPEMFEALEDAKRTIELIQPSSGYSDVPETTLEKIDALLERVRGGADE